MRILARVMFIHVAAVLATASVAAQDGVQGTTVRPMLDNAKVKGCKIAKPGEYEVMTGDLIELDYTYPVAPPAIPQKVDYNQTLIGAVVKSPLGFRNVTTPKLVGVGTIAFYFEAKKEGQDTITLDIDGVKYDYKFKVSKK